MKTGNQPPVITPGIIVLAVLFAPVAFIGMTICSQGSIGSGPILRRSLATCPGP